MSKRKDFKKAPKHKPYPPCYVYIEREKYTFPKWLITHYAKKGTVAKGEEQGDIEVSYQYQDMEFVPFNIELLPQELYSFLKYIKVDPSDVREVLYPLDFIDDNTYIGPAKGFNNIYYHRGTLADFDNSFELSEQVAAAVLVAIQSINTIAKKAIQTAVYKKTKAKIDAIKKDSIAALHNITRETVINVTIITTFISDIYKSTIRFIDRTIKTEFIHEPIQKKARVKAEWRERQQEAMGKEAQKELWRQQKRAYRERKRQEKK